MVILPGIELDYRPLSQHVGKVVGDRETLYVLNHPARYHLGVDAILARIATDPRRGLAHRGGGGDRHRHLSAAPMT